MKENVKCTAQNIQNQQVFHKGGSIESMYFHPILRHVQKHINNNLITWTPNTGYQDGNLCEGE